MLFGVTDASQAVENMDGQVALVITLDGLEQRKSELALL